MDDTGRSKSRQGALVIAAAIAPFVTLHPSGAWGEPGDTTFLGGPSAWLTQMSSDGRYVLIGSHTDLLPESGLGANLFVLDRSTGRYEAVNDQDTDDTLFGGDWLPQAVMSGDGRYIVWCSYFRALIRDRVAGATTAVMVQGRPYRTRDCNFAINEDGRYLAFVSSDSSLVPRDTNDEQDVFVLDRATGAIERINVSSAGAQANDYSYDPSISGDGRHVYFFSQASNLVTDDTNNVNDIFVRDRVSNTTTRLNVDAHGGQTSGYLPSAGFIRPPGRRLSADGRFAVFASAASTLVPGDTIINPGFGPTTDVFVVDRATGAIELVSKSSDGQFGDSNSDEPSISNDGRFVSFTSAATNLVPGDYGWDSDVFVHDRSTGRTERVSVWSSGAESTNLAYGQSWSGRGHLSGDGRYVTFSSVADLAPGAPGGAYLHENGGTDYWAFGVSPHRVDFGRWQIRTQSPPQDFTVANDSTQPLPLPTIELRGADKGDFLQSTDCPAALPVGARCTITVSFAPRSVGSKFATLKVFFDTGADGTHPVRTEFLSGAATP